MVAGGLDVSIGAERERVCDRRVGAIQVTAVGVIQCFGIAIQVGTTRLALGRPGHLVLLVTAADVDAQGVGHVPFLGREHGHTLRGVGVVHGVLPRRGSKTVPRKHDTVGKGQVHPSTVCLGREEHVLVQVPEVI